MEYASRQCGCQRAASAPGAGGNGRLVRRRMAVSYTHLVRLLMKNTIWNDYGILAVRIGLTSINIAEVEKHFVAYMQKVIVLVS